MTKILMPSIWMQCKKAATGFTQAVRRWYCEGALELLTQRCAKNLGGLAGSAGQQTKVVEA